MTLEELDLAGTILTAKLRIAIDKGFDNALNFPERLISAAGFQPPAFDLTLIQFRFPLSSHIEILPRAADSHLV
jgi:hypothetical protein